MVNMQADSHKSIRAFVVFEPSYSWGCLTVLSSLARHASRPIAVDILMRAQYRPAADKVIEKLTRAYGGRIIIRPIIMPREILDKCVGFRFHGHFIAEILFRLYYLDVADSQSDYIVHLDLDMLLLDDIFTIERDLNPGTLLHAVEEELLAPSRIVMPPHITRYLNSGFLVFDNSDNTALHQALGRAQSVVEKIAATAEYLDQDAINIAFYDELKYLPRKWNFTLSQFTGHPLPADISILHATGSRKPWFFRGGHPFSAWYEQEADLLGLSFLERYDFWWALRRLVKKTKRRFGR